MVQHAWKLFQEVELEGGFINSFKSGKIQSRIRDVRNKRIKLASQRREIFVGTNQYPNTKEQLDPQRIKVSRKSRRMLKYWSLKMEQ
jgi:methylmalonyl-CoA mutase